LNLKNYIKIAFIFFIFFENSSSATITNEQASLDRYFERLKAYSNALGPLGNADSGEIEIVTDKKKIVEIEKATGRTVGIIAEDKYWLWLNDAVKFPSGQYGVYGRLMWKCSLDAKGRPGAVVIAILPNGNVVLNRNYRHATRSWEYELPRGAREKSESLESTARREAKEETGMLVGTLTLLGEIAVDSGTLNSINTVYYAKVMAQQASAAEDSEAIASIDNFSITELKQGFMDGYLLAEIENKKQKIPLRDPTLAYALFMMELKGL